MQGVKSKRGFLYWEEVKREALCISDIVRVAFFRGVRDLLKIRISLIFKKKMPIPFGIVEHLVCMTK